MSYISETGDLVLTASNAWRREIAEIYRNGGGELEAATEFFSEGDYPTRSSRSRKVAMWLKSVLPEHIGALTDAPILAEILETDEETGEPTDFGAVFWFPDYMLRDPMRELANTGKVVFSRAPTHPAAMSPRPDLVVGIV